MKRRLSVLLTLVLCATFLLPAAPAIAQGGGGDCASPFDEHGRLPEDTMNNWQDGEPYQECLQCIEIPNLGTVGIFLTMDSYVDDQGRYYYVPNFFTSMFMAFTGWSPEFAQGPVDANMNGFEMVAALMGRYENLGGIFGELHVDFDQAVTLTGRAMTNFTDWSDFTAEDVMNIFKELAGDAVFWIRLNVALAKDDFWRGTAISWRSMVLVYCGDPSVPITTNSTPNSVPTTNWTPPPTPTTNQPVPDGYPPGGIMLPYPSTRRRGISRLRICAGLRRRHCQRIQTCQPSLRSIR